jgi:hypothetical protein
MLAVFMVAGAAAAKSIETGYELPGEDQLEKAKGLFKTTLIQPDADFKRYNEIQQRPVMLVVQAPSSEEFSTGRLTARRVTRTVIPEYDEVVEFKRIVGDAIADAIERHTDLELLDTPGPSTLVVQPVVTEVEISSSAKNRREDGHEFPELDEGTIVFDLIDGETGRILARLAENRRCKAPKGVELENGAWPVLSFCADRAAADLIHELQRLRSQSDGARSNSS